MPQDFSKEQPLTVKLSMNITFDVLADTLFSVLFWLIASLHKNTSLLQCETLSTGFTFRWRKKTAHNITPPLYYRMLECIKLLSLLCSDFHFKSINTYKMQTSLSSWNIALLESLKVSRRVIKLRHYNPLSLKALMHAYTCWHYLTSRNYFSAVSKSYGDFITHNDALTLFITQQRRNLVREPAIHPPLLVTAHMRHLVLFPWALGG